MMDVLWILAFLAVAATGIQSLETDEPKCIEKRKVVCYWASWSVYRPSLGKHHINEIVADSCTHLIYAFAGLSMFGDLESLDPFADKSDSGYLAAIALKKKNPCLKVLLAVGGWNEGSEKYSVMAESASNRERFAESVYRYVIYYGFDGIDLDWEYPGHRGGVASDKENFILLAREINKRFKKRNRLLTAAVPASIKATKIAYDVALLCRELDFVSIMGYDMQTPNVTSMHAPLQKVGSMTGESVSDVVSYYLSNGCSSEKLILGIPAYGRTFNLKDARKNGLGAVATGPGAAGVYTGEAGFVGYNEICEMQRSRGWSRVRLDGAGTYASNKNLWVSYDDEYTIRFKADYAIRQNLGGLMIWSVDTDDFQGKCGGGKYPLLRAINVGLKNPVNWK